MNKNDLVTIVDPTGIFILSTGEYVKLLDGQVVKKGSTYKEVKYD